MSRLSEQEKQYNKLANKARKGFNIMDGACSEILRIISPMIDISDPYGMHVFIQDGDGLVLSWESCRGVSNTPIRSIMSLFYEAGNSVKLDEADLLSISI